MPIYISRGCFTSAAVKGIGGVRLRRSRDAGTVANLTRSVRLLGVSMGSGR